jgi:putative ABC transport system permease protein
MSLRPFRQCLVAARVALLGMPGRAWPSLVIVLTTACVVGVLLAMLSQTEGLLRAYETGASPSRAIVMNAEYLNDYSSSITRAQAATILDGPGIARGADGTPLADPEIFMPVPPDLSYLVDGPTLRGLGPQGLTLRPGFRLVSGRLFQPGRRELVAGVQAARAFGLTPGSRVTLPDGKWPIVGTFTASGSILEGQLAGDAETIMTASHIPGFNSVLVVLDRPSALPALRSWLLGNPTLGVTAEREPDYYRRTANSFAAFFTRISYAVGAIMALGALFGSVKIMYGAVDARTREMATLRAIGYAALPLALSVMLETLVLALGGAVLGTALAWLLSSGRLIANWQNTFRTQVTPGLMGLALLWAMGLALLGGLLPAIRAARLAVSDALKEA